MLVGDPGRALLLAQALLEEPKMSNHARGLWGYSGRTPAGRELSIQATGMGGPSAALVLADLAELGVRRAIRVGTCVAIGPEPEPGELLRRRGARLGAPRGGSRRGGGAARPRPDRRLLEELGQAARPAIVASLDALHADHEPPPRRTGGAADMQTAALFSAPRPGVAIAAVLIVAESATGEQADDERIEAAAKRGGTAASTATGLSKPKVEG